MKEREMQGLCGTGVLKAISTEDFVSLLLKLTERH